MKNKCSNLMLFPAIILLLASCMPAQRLPSIDGTNTQPPALLSPTKTEIPNQTSTTLPTDPPTATLVPTETPLASHTPTSTITPTPTYTFPGFMVIMQAHCRYGPAKAYLHAADLYPGDEGLVWGRYPYSNWLYVKLNKLDYPCWLAPSVVETSGDITSLVYQDVRLPGPSVLYNPPATVSAIRTGDQVTITWSQVPMTLDDDRGYQLDLWVCQNGAFLWWPISFPDQYITTYTVIDQPGCSSPSSGKIAAVEKHGYTTWKDIFWPMP